MNIFGLIIDLGLGVEIRWHMAKIPAVHPSRLLLVRTSTSIESRPAGLDSTLPELAAVLEAFRRSDRAQNPLTFTFVTAESHSYVVRAEHREAASDEASLEAIAAPIPLALSPRELDVVSLMCVGASYASIARALHLSLSTVTTHAEHIFAKLSVRTRTDAVLSALEHGAIRLPLPAIVPSDTFLGRLGRTIHELEPADWQETRAPQMTSLTRKGASFRSIRIGCLYPLTLSEGQDMLFGAQLAVEEINANGGVNNRTLELFPVGVDVSSLDAILEGTDAVLGENADALAFGYLEPRNALAELLSVWGESGIPVLHSLTSQLACEIVSTGQGRYDNIFQVCTSDDFYGDEFLRFARHYAPASSGLTQSRDIVMLTDDPQMVLHSERWAERARDLGRDLTLIPVQDEAMAITAARTVSAESPAIVFLACFSAALTKTFMREFQAHPTRSLVYALWAPGTSAFKGDLGDFEGLVWSTATGRYADALGQGFESRFHKRYGRPVAGTSASIQYDSIGILAHSWQRSGKPSSYRSTGDELRQLIHRGVNGSYFFGAEFQRPLAFGIESQDASLSQAHLIYQIQDGANRIISPAPYAVSTYRAQPWLRQPPPD